VKIIQKFLDEQQDKSNDEKQVVKCIVRDEDGSCLFLRRAVTTSQPITSFTGGWDLPGGHVHSGEELKDATTREVKEETNCDITGCKKLKTIKVKIPDQGKPDTVHIFEANKTPKSDLILNMTDYGNRQPEHSEFKWVKNQDELEGMPMLNDLKKGVIEYLVKR